MGRYPVVVGIKLYSQDPTFDTLFSLPSIISPAIGKIGKDASIRRQLDSGKLARRTGSRNASHREKSALKLTASQPNWLETS